MRDGAQSSGFRFGLRLVRKIGAVNDSRERLERRIARTVLVDQGLEGAAAASVLVRIGGARRVESLRALLALHSSDFLRRNEDELRLGIDEAANEPRRRNAVHPGVVARHPFHRAIPCRRIRPAAPAARMITGSGIFRALIKSASTTTRITAIGTSMIDRRPITKAAPAIAPAAAAV